MRICSEMLEFEPGKIKDSDRYLFLNTIAMGTLIRDLISTLGKERAKGFLVRYGWFCGINDAISICKKHPDAPMSFLIRWFVSVLNVSILFYKDQL